MAVSARRRVGGGPGPVQWLALGGAVLVMLGLTFALGLLVGRQWARQSATALIASAAEPARKPAGPLRRGGIAAETMADRVPEPTEKLTFYETLTEPLDGQGAPPRAEAKPVSVKIPAATPSAIAAARPAPPAPAPPLSLPPKGTAKAGDGKPATEKIASGRPADRKAADHRPADGGAVPGPPQTSNNPHPWTVQVGAFKNRRQAEDSRQQLASAGLDAYVVTVAAQDGVARYRVRVGTFRSPAAAERLRSQRSLTTFVTPK
jgi:cell division protein FtsN